MTVPLLEIRNLGISIGALDVVRGVDLTLEQG